VEALKDGFDLRWTGNYDRNYDQCQRCIGSGGVCGNEGRSEFRCFCIDGPYKTLCNFDKASSSSKRK
jgi:hypothetical protein